MRQRDESLRNFRHLPGYFLSLLKEDPEFKTAYEAAREEAVQVLEDEAIRSSLLVLGKLQKPESLGDVKGVGHWSLPRNLVTIGRWSLAAKQIYAENIADGCRPGVNCRIRNCHRSIPNVGNAIDSR